MKPVSEKTKLILRSVAPLAIILVLFAIVGNFGISRIIATQSRISKAQLDKTVLSQKKSLLDSVNQTVAEDSGVALSALPDRNPSLAVISQMKNLGVSNGVAVSGAKSAAPIDDKGGVSHVVISFEVLGDRSKILSFLKSISSVAPITLIDKVRVSESAGVTRADVSVKSYWAVLPKTIPNLTTPITDLAAAEKKILEEVSVLTQPEFLDVPASDEGGKTDPFASN